MSWKRSLSLAAAAVAAVAAGCASLPVADRTGPAAQNPPPAAEPLKERLDNQARAIVELSSENEKLLARLDELRKEVARLQALLDAQGKAPDPKDGAR